MRNLNFLIKPASHLCNLACDYCFYRRVAQVYPEGDRIMSAAVAETLIKPALSLGAARNSFCWQGGEPTLCGLDFFKHAAALQQQYRQPGQVVENSIQTNGLLLDRAWAVFLRRNRFLVGLSLDGPIEAHDRYRKTGAGRGTFRRVMAAADLLREEGVDFNILTLLTDANIHQPENLYAFFRGQGFRHLQFIPCLDTDPATGEPRSYSIDADALGRFYTRLFDLWLDDGFPEVSIRLFEDILIYLLDGVRLSCSWLDCCDSYLLVEHNGDCYPCDFFVYPEWRLGNLDAENLAFILDSPRRREFARLKSAWPNPCRICHRFDFCRGDCTRFRSAPGRPEDHSLLCRAWKTLLDHIESHPAGVVNLARQARASHQNRPPVEIGRNDPCPCGSGRKYKKCCGGVR
jgi:uncharacterized protein